MHNSDTAHLVDCVQVDDLYLTTAEKVPPACNIHRQSLAGLSVLQQSSTQTIADSAAG